MIEAREQEALNAYLNLLQKKGATNEYLKKRADLLTKLAKLIQAKANDGYMYRDALEAVLEKLDRKEWPEFIAMARDFYHFWIKDIKAIAALNSESAFDIEPVKWQPLEANLKVLWNMLDKEKFSTSETWPLKAYTLALRQEGAAQALVDTRVKLVKLLLIRLRDAPERNHRIYRIAADCTVPLFTLQDTRRLFLVVVREFYYFWAGDPEAAKYILRETTGQYI